MHRLQCRAQAGQDYRSKPRGDVRVLVVGATGYIGKYVVKELVKRGYNVVAFSREKSGIGGKSGQEDTVKVGFESLIQLKPFKSKIKCWAQFSPVTHPAVTRKI